MSPNTDLFLEGAFSGEPSADRFPWSIDFTVICEGTPFSSKASACFRRKEIKRDKLKVRRKSKVNQELARTQTEFVCDSMAKHFVSTNLGFLVKYRRYSCSRTCLNHFEMYKSNI